MTSAVVTTTPTPSRFRAYITTADYHRAPTGVDVSNLVKGDPAATEQELGRRILAASGWADRICGQTIAATVDTESVRGLVGRDGILTVHPRFFPIISVDAFAVGTTPGGLVPMSDLSQIWLEEQQFQVPIGGASMWSSAGPLQFSSGARPGGPVRMRYTYTSGYAMTTLAAPALAGATSIQVADATGIVPGLTELMIYDDTQTEVIQVATVVGTTLTLTDPLAWPHAVTGVEVSAIPATVKQAVVLLTSSLIQTRGAVALIAPAVAGLSARYTESGSNKGHGTKLTLDDSVTTALSLLEPLRRTR